MSRVEMLNEYFSFNINSRGELESLPLLLRDYTPNLDKLPLFLMRLGPQVFPLISYWLLICSLCIWYLLRLIGRPSKTASPHFFESLRISTRRRRCRVDLKVPQLPVRLDQPRKSSVGKSNMSSSRACGATWSVRRPFWRKTWCRSQIFPICTEFSSDVECSSLHDLRQGETSNPTKLCCDWRSDFTDCYVNGIRGNARS